MLHLGPLHPIESAITVILALAPFIILGVVVLIARKRD